MTHAREKWISIGALTLFAGALAMSALILSGCSESGAQTAVSSDTSELNASSSIDGVSSADSGPREFPYDELNVTEEQRTKIETLLADYRSQFEALKPQDGTKPTAETRESVRALRDSLKSDMSAILSDEQLVTLKELKKNRRSRNRNGERSAERRIAKMSETLDLTAEQQTRVAALFGDMTAKRKELRASGVERGSDEAKQLRQEFRAQLSAILTDEQQVTWQATIDERKKKGFRHGAALGGPGRRR